MDLQLRDRVVLVVGGTGFIGSAIVTRARAEGATVIVASRTAVDNIGVDNIAVDAGDERSVARAVACVLVEHGRLDEERRVESPEGDPELHAVLIPVPYSLARSCAGGTSPALGCKV